MKLSGAQDLSPNRCVKRVNLPGGVDIGSDDDSVTSYYLC